MFSPNLTRFIIDPDNVTEEFNAGKNFTEENQLLMRGTLDYEKVLSDYNFFSRLLYEFNKLLCGF